MIKPIDVVDFYSEGQLSAVEKDFDQGAETVQKDLYGKRMPKLTQFNHIFKYHYLCPGPECKGHRMQCEDWELFAALRSWRERYGESELWEKLRGKFYDWMWGKRDLYFYLGTHSRWATWMIIGVYYPPLGS